MIDGHFEGVKYAYRQNKDGMVIQFVVHPEDMCREMANAPIGSTFKIIYVETTGGEEDKNADERARQLARDVFKAGEAQPEEPKERKRFEDMSRAQQAGILCQNTVFHDFLKCHYLQAWERASRKPSLDGNPDKDIAAEALRLWFGIDSRSELDLEPRHARIFDDIVKAFAGYKTEQRYADNLSRG